MIAFNRIELLQLVENKKCISEISFDNIRIGQHYKTIDIEQIIEIFIKDETMYNSMNDFTLKERITFLSNKNGFVHLAGGLSCGIQNQLITDYRIFNRYLECVSEYSKNDIEKYHGKAENIVMENDIYQFYNTGCLFYIYKSKNLSFKFDSTEKLIEIATIIV